MDNICNTEAGSIQTKARRVTPGGAVALFCTALLIVALCVPLLLTLPRTLDAAVGAVGVVEEASAAVWAPLGQPAGTYDEQWVDTLDEGEIAQWRMRASD